MEKTVLIGVTSGIAAYKSLDLIKLLKKAGINVIVIMTKSATQMVNSKDFEKASGRKVYIDLFESGFDYRKILKTRKVDHIELADSADLMVIVPATANVIAKLAHGLADDFLTTTTLAVTAPILICPSMNVNMWNNPLVGKNVATLKSFGYQILGPTSGMLACGYEGKGRLIDINLIRDEIINQLRRTDSLKDQKIIITTGGTSEKIDDVRFITNRSSGKMGIAIAEACYLCGADVLLLRAKNSVTPRYLIKEEVFTSADDLFSLVKKYVKSYDIIFHVAAVSDFQIAKSFNGKISSNRSMTLALKPRTKILDQIKELNPKIKLIAFKAEHGLTEKELVNVSFRRLKESHADVIIANDISKKDRGFEVDTNEVLIILPDKSVKKIPLSSKRIVASKIVDHLNILLLPK